MSTKNYYEILQVSPLASPTAIKKAYRRLAHQHHPDKNKNNPKAEETFKQINEAYHILSDTFKRKELDRQIKKAKQQKAEKTNQGFSPLYDSFHSYPVPPTASTPPKNSAEVYPGQPPFPTEGPPKSPPEPPSSTSPSSKKNPFSLQNLKDWYKKGTDHPVVACAELKISIEEAILGGKKTISLNVRRKSHVKKETFTVTIPPGARENQNIKINSHPDLYVSLVYEEHPLFKVEGAHIRMDLPVPFTKAILGGEVRLPTPRGEVSFQLPATTHGAHVVQLKGQGFPLPHLKQRGHMLINIVIDIPSDLLEQEKVWIQSIHNRKAICPKVAEFDIKTKLLLKKRKTRV